MRYGAIVWHSLACILLTGCSLISNISDSITNSRIDGVISDYHRLSPQIHIGDPKGKVDEILGPLQDRLNATERRSHQSYLRDGKLVEIIFARTQRVSLPVGMTTNAEFTPFVFLDGKLQGIGWTALDSHNAGQ